MTSESTLRRVAGEQKPGRRPYSFHSKRRRHELIAGVLFLLPDGIGLMLFVAVPMAFSLLVSFFNVNEFGTFQFVGLQNFRQLFSDPLLLKSLGISAAYLVVFVPVTFFLSLMLAILVNDKFPGVAVIRTLLFIPYVLSLVVIALLWQFMLVDKRGIITELFSSIGLPGISWLGSPSLALTAVLVISIWYTMGYQMFLFLGGLSDVPQEYLDASKVDGANAWTRFWRITWPLLEPTSFFVLITSLVAALTGVQAFDLVYVLTKGGPANSTTTTVFYIYQQAFTNNNYGYASAITVMLVLFLLLVTVILLVFSKGGRFHADGN